MKLLVSLVVAAICSWSLASEQVEVKVKYANFEPYALTISVGKRSAAFKLPMRTLFSTCSAELADGTVLIGVLYDTYQFPHADVFVAPKGKAIRRVVEFAGVGATDSFKSFRSGVFYEEQYARYTNETGFSPDTILVRSYKYDSKKQHMLPGSWTRRK